MFSPSKQQKSLTFLLTPILQYSKMAQECTPDVTSRLTIAFCCLYATAWSINFALLSGEFVKSVFKELTVAGNSVLRGARSKFDRGPIEEVRSGPA